MSWVVRELNNFLADMIVDVVDPVHQIWLIILFRSVCSYRFVFVINIDDYMTVLSAHFKKQMPLDIIMTLASDLFLPMCI